MSIIFKKRKEIQSQQFMMDILNAIDNDVVVIRGNDCEVLFMNTAARTRIYADDANGAGVSSYLDCFPDLCSQALRPDDDGELPHNFETTSHNGIVFSANRSTVNWTDGAPASIIFLQDITKERETKKKLYDLAYMDYLTGVPNRQKLREDFEAISEGIQWGRKSGIVAIFDLDNFKTINDTYGHNTGDILLKRLTEHLTSDEDFSGRLYRLGGDEFVLFFSGEAGEFGTGEEMHEHFSQLLERAFVAYTMPNIEVACTISMGASFFPEHGYTYSDLLRKADIALYKAKAAGRNRLVLFKDQYDAAKKFKDLYINIQPILTADENTYGYEMVDSGNKDGDVLNLSEFDRTMDALGFSDLESNARYFIGYSHKLLEKSIRNNLPKDKFIVQVRLTYPVDENLSKQLRELKKYGYQLALDIVDFECATSEYIDLATYCKFPVSSPDAARLQRLIKKNPDKRFIATGIDTLSDYETAQMQGFTLYQGFFFSQPPQVKKTKDISPLKVNYYRLLQLTSTEGYVNFSEISNVISSDLALSYKLLRLLNSAAVGLRNRIASIEMAVAFLGEENLKKWIAMLALRGVADDKPLELVRLSLIRAQFGELLAPHLTPKLNPKHAFMTGMFSLLHIALEQSKEDLLNDMPVADDIRNSLLTSNGPYSELIDFFTAYEYANWDAVSEFAEKNNLSDQLINDCYIKAIRWYNNLTKEDMEKVD